MNTATLAHASPFLSAVRQQFATWFSVRTPTPARPLSRFEEAEQLREMASELVRSDPGFAQDLFAAADRHEQEGSPLRR